MFSRDTEPKGHTQIYEGSYNIGIGSHGMEAERSGYLLAANWATRKADGVIYLGSKARNQDSRWWNSVWDQRPEKGGPSPRAWRPKNRRCRAGEGEHSNSGREIKKREFVLPPLLFFTVFHGLDDAHIGKGRTSSLSLLMQMLTFPEILLQTHPEVMFYLLSGHPLTQSSWHL